MMVVNPSVNGETLVETVRQNQTGVLQRKRKMSRMNGIWVRQYDVCQAIDGSDVVRPSSIL